MLYLIQALWPFLLLCMGFAAVAGWAVAAGRAAPGAKTRERERAQLLRDLAKLAAGEEGLDARVEEARAAEARQSLADIQSGRVAELEHALEIARERAEDATAELAELRRRLEEAEIAPPTPAPRAVMVDPQAEALQAWRLRYFEQRVRYLEGQAAAPRALPAPPAPPVMEWRAREAEARADYLATELRSLRTLAAEAAAEEAAAPFAANIDVDMLLRWRMLYLERRQAHFRQMAARQSAAEPAEGGASGPDPERWKWRARYLESRIRELEQRPTAEPARAMAPQSPAAPIEAEAPALEPQRVAAKKPPGLPAARNGAPDDLTLIEDVSALQQSTLNALGVFHFDQIAAWTPENVAWVDNYLRLRGRIADEEWIEQAAALAREGVAAARRELVSEGA